MRDPTDDELTAYRRMGCGCFPVVAVIGITALGLEELYVWHEDGCPIVAAARAQWN